MEQTAKAKKAPVYLTKISRETFDKLKEQILHVLVVEKRYRESGFSAHQLAEMLHTNTRYVSIVLSVRYHANFAQFINKLRIEEASGFYVQAHQFSLMSRKRQSLCNL